MAFIQVNTDNFDVLLVIDEFPFVFTILIMKGAYTKIVCPRSGEPYFFLSGSIKRGNAEEFAEKKGY